MVRKYRNNCLSVSTFEQVIMNSNRSLFTMIVAATMFSSGVFSGPWLSSPSQVYAQPTAIVAKLQLLTS